jgi:hypothetical protein
MVGGRVLRGGKADLEVGVHLLCCYLSVVGYRLYLAAVAGAGWVGLLVCLSLPEAQFIGD